MALAKKLYEIRVVIKMAVHENLQRSAETVHAPTEKPFEIKMGIKMAVHA